MSVKDDEAGLGIDRCRELVGNGCTRLGYKTEFIAALSED